MFLPFRIGICEKQSWQEASNGFIQPTLSEAFHYKPSLSVAVQMEKLQKKTLPSITVHYCLQTCRGISILKSGYTKYKLFKSILDQNYI